MTSLLLCALAFHAGEVDMRAIQAIERFDAVYAKAKALKFVMQKRDRLRDGQEIREAVLVKFRKPGDYYLASIEPRVGQEVLYVPQKDRNKLLVHPGTFPDLTLWLSIHGDLALKNQHHPIYHIDPGYALKFMRTAARDVVKDRTLGVARWVGEETRYKRPVIITEMAAGNKAPRRVAAQKGESLIDFAQRNNSDPYVCYVANPNVRALNSRLDEGALYNIPPYYGERSEFAFDKENGFLIEHKIFNGDGELYEQLARVDLEVDPTLADVDFDQKNPAYKF